MVYPHFFGPVEHAQCVILSQELYRVNFSMEKDEITWALELSGKFLVKSILDNLPRPFGPSHL
jgi:hypothetical protein